MVLGVQTGLALPEVVVSAVRYCLSSMPFVAIEPVRLDARPLFEALGDGRVDFALASVHRGGGAACGHVAHRRGEGTRLSGCPRPFPPARRIGSARRGKADVPFFRWRPSRKPPCAGRISAAATASCRSLRPVTACPRVSPASSWGSAWACCRLAIRRLRFPAIRRIGLAQAYCEHTSLIWNAANLNSIVDVFAKLVEGDLWTHEKSRVCGFEFEWCGREDLNLHGVAPIRT